MALALPRLGIGEALGLEGALFLDTRSPGEYAQDHLPGARLLPLFDDQERAIVGTLYRQRGPDAAWERGLAFVLASMERLVREAAALTGHPLAPVDRERILGLAARLRSPPSNDADLRAPPATGYRPSGAPVVIYCWRGGMRSRTVALLLRELGLDCAQLVGGYKAYRRQVIDELCGWPYPPMLALHGLTGVGKTLIIRRLAAAFQGRVLDLEDLAGHRSSVLGPVGLRPATPRAFESRLLARMRLLDPVGPWLVEWEGRKLGDIVLPERYHQAAGAGWQIELTAPIELRADRLVDEYVTSGDIVELRRLLPFFERSLGREGLAVLLQAFDEGRYRDVALCLLERHYDPRYRHAMRGRTLHQCIEAIDLGRAAAAVAALWAEAPTSLCVRKGTHPAGCAAS